MVLTARKVPSASFGVSAPSTRQRGGPVMALEAISAAGASRIERPGASSSSLAISALAVVLSAFGYSGMQPHTK